MEDVNRADKSGMYLKPHSDVTPVLDKPWKMSTELISLECVLKPHSDACFG